MTIYKIYIHAIHNEHLKTLRQNMLHMNIKKYKNIQWQISSTKIFIEKIKINVQWIMILKHNSRQLDQSLKNTHAQVLLKQKCDHQDCKPTFPIKEKKKL